MQDAEVSRLVASYGDFYDPSRASGTTGVIELELVGRSGGRWYLELTTGHLSVTTDRREASAKMRSTAAVWGAIMSGTRDAAEAVVHGDLQVSGDMALLNEFARVVPTQLDRQGAHS